MKKEKNNPKFGELILIESHVKRFCFNNLHQDYNIMKYIVYTVMDVCWNNRRNENVY